MEPRSRFETIAELVTPGLIALAAGLFVFFALRRGWYHFAADFHFSDIYSAQLTVCVISAGFLAAVATILLALDERPVIARLKQWDIYKRLFGSIIWAICWAFACAFYTDVLYLVQGLSSATIAHCLTLAIWAAISVMCGLRLLFVVAVFAVLIKKNS